MEYRKHLKGNTLSNTIEVTIPDVYVNVDKGYADELAKRKEALLAFGKEANKKRKTFFITLFLIIFAALTVIATIIELIIGLETKYIIVSAAGAALIALAAATPISQSNLQKLKAKQEKMSNAYYNDRVQFKANEYLYGVLQYCRIVNIIMSAGNLTIQYYSTDGQGKCDSFKYEEWEGDEDLKTPFLLFENNHLYGRSSSTAESTEFTTSIVE